MGTSAAISAEAAKMLDFVEIFDGAPVPTWLRSFSEDANAAVEDLLVSRADLGTLAVAEPSELLLDWLEGLGVHAEFVERTDRALARWIDRSWGDPTLESALHSATLTAVAWCRAAEVIAAEPRLTVSARTLRTHFLEDRAFLHNLSEDRARDPQGRAWLALARHQEDRSLLPEWWRQVSLPPEEPWYRGIYGIHGLRGLPPAPGQLGSGLSQEIQEGLARLADGLAHRAEEGWLEPRVAREEFTRTAHLTMAAYPAPERWLRFWRHALRGRRGELTKEWIQGLFPEELRNLGRQPREARSRWVEPDPGWKDEAHRIALSLAAEDWGAVADAERLLDNQAQYARATGDTEFVVKSASHFAGRARRRRPDLALRWANLARSFDSWHDYAWTIAASTLLAMGETAAARRMALEAVERFPHNPVAATTLAEALAAAGSREEAANVYRATCERFPRGVVARTSLAKILVEQEQFQEAGILYREVLTIDAKNAYALNGLAEILALQGRAYEAVEAFRQVLRLRPENLVARTSLAKTLVEQEQFQEAGILYREVLAIEAKNGYALTGLAEILARQGRTYEAAEALRQVLHLRPENLVARTSLAKILGEQGQLQEAERLYREVLSRAPRDEYAKAGLRRLGLDDEADKQVLPPPAPLPDASALPRDRAVAATFGGNVKPERVADQSTPSLELPEVNPLAPPASGTPTDRKESEPRVPSTSPLERHRPSLESSEVEILVQDAYLLRRWSRYRSGWAGPELPGALRQEARDLLRRLETASGSNAQAAGELGLLKTAEGDLDAAVALLREAAKRFPASARLRYALGQAERRLAERERQRFEPTGSARLLEPWRRLGHLDLRYRPVQLLGEARAWLAQVDGQTVEEGARAAFVELERWIAKRVQLKEGAPATDDLGALREAFLLAGGAEFPEHPDFSDWWAREIQVHLFGSTMARSQEELSSLAPVRDALAAHARTIDILGEDYVRRLEPTGHPIFASPLPG